MSSVWPSIDYPGLQKVNYTRLTKSKSTGTSNTLGSLNTGRGVESSYQQAIKEGACWNSHWNEKNKICVIIYKQYLRSYTHSVSRLLPLNEIPSFIWIPPMTLGWLSHVICPNNLFSVQAVCAKFHDVPVKFPQRYLKKTDCFRGKRLAFIGIWLSFYS